MDLQKAVITKRAAAWLLDAILMGVIALGCAVLLTVLFRFDDHNTALNQGFAEYEQQYGPAVNATEEEYTAMSQAQKDSYGELAYRSQLVFNLTLIIITISLLIGVMVTQFVIPLFLKNGQTVGKKAFSLGLMRVDGVKINNLQLFVRALLGKFTIGTMVPVYLALKIFVFFTGNIVDLCVLAGVLLLQFICVCVTQTNSPIHDLMAGTVAIDFSSQRVFESPEALIEYTKRIAAEKAKRQEY